MVRVGVGSFIGLGEITSWDGTVSASNIKKYYRSTSSFDNMQVERDTIYFDDFSNIERLAAGTYAGVQRVTGSFEVYPTYQDLPYLLQQILEGDDSISALGTASWRHTVSSAQKGDSNYHITGNYLVAEINRGGDSNSQFYHPLRVTGATFTFEPNSFLVVSCDVIGKTYTIASKSSDPSYGSNPIYLTTGQSTDALVFKIGSSGASTAYTLKSANISVSTPLDERRDITDIYTSEPLYSDFREITLEATIESDSTSETNLLTALTAGTQIYDLVLTIDSGVEIETGYNYKMVITIARAHLNAPVEAHVTGMGVTEATIKFTAINDETNPTIKFEVDNDQNAV